MSSVVSIKQLLGSGIHFGSAVRKCHYKMKPFLFSNENGVPIVRNRIHIIDLRKSIEAIESVYVKIVELIKNNGKILFLGTKKQIREIIQQEAERAKQYYVSYRWLGGTFTNFQTIFKRINFLKDLYKQEKDGLWSGLSKKEIMTLTRKREKLEKFLGGIKDMNQLPQAIFVVDVKKDIIAITEARKLNIKVFGIIDSDCDPDLVDYIIPANNDAIKGVKLVTSIIANAVVEAETSMNNAKINLQNIKEKEKLESTQPGIK